MIAFVVIVFYLILILLDFLPVAKNKKKSEIWVYSIVLVLTFGALMFRSLNLTLPAIYPTVKTFIETLFK